MYLTFKYRLTVTKSQHEALLRICDSQRELYNAALEEKIDCFRKTGKNLTWVDQQKSLTECRKMIASMRDDPLNVQRGTIRQVHSAFAGFFSRIRKDGHAGLPRFRGRYRSPSFVFVDFAGQFDGKKIRFKGIPGGIRVRLHRPVAKGRICVAKFKRDARGWFVAFSIKIADVKKIAVKNAIGIDLGIKNLAQLSDGSLIPNIRPALKLEKEMRRRQRALSRRSRGSKRQAAARVAVSKVHRKIANTRRTYLHQCSVTLVKTYDLIAVENLNVKGLRRSMLAKSIHDVSWATFVSMIAYKAERAGKHLIKVDPRFTTQACSSCGAIVPKTLSVRTHDCQHCGTLLDRDHNAALNVLRKGVLALEALNVAQWGERALGNTVDGRDCTYYKRTTS